MHSESPNGIKSVRPGELVCDRVDVGTVRIHRYRDHFRIWDLTNAGKRGKKVRTMTIGPSYSYKGDHDKWMEHQAKYITNYRTYDAIKNLYRDLLVDYPGEINIDESQERGIDVNPGGTETHKFKTTTGLEVEAEPMAFRILNRWELPSKTGEPSGMFQDTNYYPVKKQDAQKFYN